MQTPLKRVLLSSYSVLLRTKLAGSVRSEQGQRACASQQGGDQAGTPKLISVTRDTFTRLQGGSSGAANNVLADALQRPPAEFVVCSHLSSGRNTLMRLLQGCSSSEWNAVSVLLHLMPHSRLASS